MHQVASPVGKIQGESRRKTEGQEKAKSSGLHVCPAGFISMVLFRAPCGVSVSSNSCFAWDGRNDEDHGDVVM